jgi:antirestriction protein
MTITQAKEMIGTVGKKELRELIEEHGREFIDSVLSEGNIDADEVPEFIEEHGKDKIESAISCGVNLSDIDEAYQGQFRSDQDFAQDMADQLGEIDRDAKWPHNCIDWQHAARELMYDYSEDGGYYWRSL